MKAILESYSIKELKDFIRSHNKDVRKQTSEKIKQIRKNINKKRIIDIKGLNKKTDKDEIISKMLKEKQHFKDIKMKKQISQQEKEKFMDDVLNPLLKKAYLVYARTGDEDDVEVEVEEIFKKAKEMDIPSNYGISKKKMIKIIVDEGKKDKKIRDEIISKRKTDKNIPPPKPPMPPNMFYSTQAKKFIINKPTRPAPKLPPKPTKKAPSPPKAKGKEKVSNQDPAPSSLQELVGDRPKKKKVIKILKKEEPKKEVPKKEEPKKETKREKIIRERKKDRGKILPIVEKIKRTWRIFMEDEYLGDDYTLEEQKAEYDELVKINSKLPNSIPSRIKLNEFDKPKQEVFLKLFRTNFLNYIDLESDKTGTKKEFIKEREKDKKEKEDKAKKSEKKEIKKEEEKLKTERKDKKERIKKANEPTPTKQKFMILKEEINDLLEKTKKSYQKNKSKLDKMTPLKYKNTIKKQNSKFLDEAKDIYNSLNYNFDMPTIKKVDKRFYEIIPKEK